MEITNVIDPGYCLEDNADFIRISNGGGLKVLRRSFDTPALHECIEVPDSFLSKSEILKDSRTTKAGLTKLSSGKIIFIKRYNNKGLKYSLSYLFREARPFRSWKTAWAFEQLGIPTPHCMAALADRKAGFLTSAFLITEALDNTVPTLDFYKTLSNNDALYNTYVNTICSYIALFHNASITHGDLKLSNIYARKSSSGEYSFGLWDMDGSRFHSSPLSIKERAQEMGRVISSYIEIGKRLEITVNREDIQEAFSDAYEKSSGIRLDKKELELEVVHYLNKTLKRNNES